MVRPINKWICYGLCILNTVLISVSYAQDSAKESTEADRLNAGRGVPDDEYEFSWLDTDKKVYVLQNRKYQRAKRFGLFAQGGPNLSNVFRTEFVFVPRVSYYLNNKFGFEFFGGIFSNSDSSTLDALKRVSSALPFVRQHEMYYAGVFCYNPFYAKMNFFNTILYFDWFFNAGLGSVNTKFDQNTRAGAPVFFKEENFIAAFFGTGMNFYVTNHWSVRLDLVGDAYSGVSADNITKKTYLNFDFVIGGGYIF